MLKPIRRRLHIESDGFGDYNEPVVHGILNHIALITLSSSLIDETSIPPCRIIHWNMGYPMCSNVGDERFIFLTTGQNKWCQWTYQFSHEYCHHAINGKMSGGLGGQMWFEETLCELNSIYQLHLLSTALPDDQRLSYYAPAVREYLDDLLQSHQDLKSELQSHGSVRQWLPLLYQPEYHREYYNAVACRIFPLFVENPRLWGILGHIGDSRSYPTLDELFRHLQDTADDFYRDSLARMINLLS